MSVRSQPTGVVVIDTNVLNALGDPTVQTRVRRSMRAADFALRPSALTVLELLINPHREARNRRLLTLGALADGFSILPAPFDLLEQVGKAILDGKSGFVVGHSEYEWVVNEPEALQSAQIDKVKHDLERTKQRWDQAHRKARRKVRSVLKANGMQDPWGSIAAFLDQQWTRREHLQSHIETHWQQFALPGSAPTDLVLASEPWRLYFEGLGAAVYERAVVGQSPRPAHALDVIQLVYMAAAPRRILVTDDGGLRRVAEAVLLGRYANARVLSSADFIALAP